MKNVKERLKGVLEFEDFVKGRAIDLIEAKGLNRDYHKYRYDFYIREVTYASEGVECVFIEDTTYDTPETYYTPDIGEVRLKLSDLEISNKEWEEKILKIKNDLAKEEMTEIEKEKEREREEKEKQFFKLKKGTWILKFSKGDSSIYKKSKRFYRT